MEKTSKGMRLHIGLFGRTNVGKSSLLNLLAGQDAAITSAVPGTTTDVVEKTMELLPLGPVVFLDTAGINDASALGEQRKKRTRAAMGRSDIAVLVIEPGCWDVYEDEIVDNAKGHSIPLLIFVNKVDLGAPDDTFVEKVRGKAARILMGTCYKTEERERVLSDFKDALVAIKPSTSAAPPLVGDLVPLGGLVVLVVPIDLQAPKGRLILPQVQVIRDILDNDASVLVVKEREYAAALQQFRQPPNLVICDSQVVLKTLADTPATVPCTTFSILFARLKGNLAAAASAAAVIDTLVDGDKILIAEACSHHAMADDIGRVKIPRWMRQYTGRDLIFESSAGRDYPENIDEYALVVHCGGCMLNRQEMLGRIKIAGTKQVPVTNYGVTIACVQGVLERALFPFPSAALAYRNARKQITEEI